jgi:two-component system KDP operon response regulator KdpE
MPRRPTILVIDGEPASRYALRKVLANAGYKVVEASTGAEALERISTDNCEMIVLDPALSDMDGFDVMRGVRQQSHLPVIVLSICGDEQSKVRAFDLGADDYVTKPFAEGELLARMRAALRHRFQAKGEEPNFVSGDLVVDLVRREVRVRERPVGLTPIEYQVLSLLVRHAGKVLTHRRLTGEIWGDSRQVSVQRLRVAIAELRRKIEPAPARPIYILTETRIGYRLSIRHPPLKFPQELT